MADALERLDDRSGDAGASAPAYQLADRIIALADFMEACDPARKDSLAAEYGRLSLQLSRGAGRGRAFFRSGRVLVPIRGGGGVRCLVLPATDLNAEALDHFEQSVISAAERSIAGHQLAGDRRSLVDAFLLCTDCSGSQAAELVDALAGLDRLAPSDLAGFRHLAGELLARRPERARRPETPSEGDPVAYLFPFENPPEESRGA
jgi:hypothetical protein